MPERPRVATLLNSLANYNVAIPSVTEDHKIIPKVSFLLFLNYQNVNYFNLIIKNK